MLIPARAMPAPILVMAARRMNSRRSISGSIGISFPLCGFLQIKDVCQVRCYGSSRTQ